MRVAGAALTASNWRDDSDAAQLELTLFPVRFRQHI
jgi:hypothetical protein